MEKNKEVDVNSDTPFYVIAEELGEETTSVFATHKRALVKLEVALRRMGYKKSDFLGD